MLAQGEIAVNYACIGVDDSELIGTFIFGC